MFSVIIPLYNKPDSIQDTLTSVLQQTFDEFEVIVVNDGSTDQSREKAAEITDSRIRITDQKNGGIASARNTGIKQSNFRYIAFLDADDIWEPDYLAEQKKLIEDYPGAKMWGTSWGTIRNNVKTRTDHGIADDFRGYFENYFGTLKKTNLFFTSAIVIDKTVFNELELHDERITSGQDLDLIYRIILNYKVVFYNKEFAHYKLDAENRISLNQPPLSGQLPYFIEKYNPYRDSHPDFKTHFDRLCLRNLYPYFLKGKYQREISYILSHIDFSEQPLRWWFRYKLPRVRKFYVEIKGLIQDP